MIGASKILTVSYGTFSCTLEGFDDPFTTMRAIAEYFRDLAADDRYFGAEPPTPDAAMLHRIAEREERRRVEARLDDRGVTLRAAEPGAHLPSAAVAVPVAVPADAATPAPALADATDMPDGVAARLARIRAAVAEAEAAAAARYVEDEDAPERSDLAALFAAEPAPASGGAEDEAATTVAADPDDTGPQDAAPIPAAPAEHATADLDRHIALATPEAPAPEVRAPAGDAAVAAGQADRDGIVTGPGDDGAPQAARTSQVPVFPDDEIVAEVDDPLFFDPLEAPAAREAPLAEARLPEARLAEARLAEAGLPEAGLPDAGLAESRSEADRPEAGVAAAEAAPVDRPDVAVAAPDPADAVAAAPDTVAETAPDTAPETVPDTVPDTSPGTVAASAAGPAAEPLDAAGAPAALAEKALRARARVVRVRRAAAPAPAPVAADGPVADAAPDAAAAPPPPVAEAHAEAHAGAARDDAAPGAPADDAALATALSAILRDAEPPPAADAARSPAPVEETAVSRLMEQTRTEMAVPENRRRLSAIAHLKAAVAATVAERLRFGRPRTEEREETRTEAYRDDLARVVRPRRPEGTPDEGERAAPLVLVSSQRIDRPQPAATPAAAPVAPVAPVRPRRIAGAAAAALLEEDEGGPVDNIFADVRGFAEFAENVGAHALPDLIEAAAAYAAAVEGRDQFTRPQLMRQVETATGELVREDGLRSFGALLREGRIVKVTRGRFSVTQSSRFLAEARKLAG